jgi:hypothetical protein
MWSIIILVWNNVPHLKTGISLLHVKSKTLELAAIEKIVGVQSREGRGWWRIVIPMPVVFCIQIMPKRPLFCHGYSQNYKLTPAYDRTSRKSSLRKKVIRLFVSVTKPSLLHRWHFIVSCDVTDSPHRFAVMRTNYNSPPRSIRCCPLYW